MRVITDFHIHSPFARATSKDISIRNLEKYARIKGLDLLGTGDFTHPKWMAQLKDELKPDGNGTLLTKSGFPFVLSAEISNIYSENGKVMKIHNLILAPDFETADSINDLLSKKGNLSSDGRPIFGKYPCYRLVEDLKNIDEKIEIIPAHVWTPWFGLFGSNSGFDSVDACFRDQAKHIHALETGLSSDPAMNWRISSLDRYTLVSNSDLHSYWPWRLGREANVIEMKDITYRNLILAIRSKRGFIETIEVDPNFGKYHFTGHRNCNVVLSPVEAQRIRNICPVCKSKLTVGVLERVEELADRPQGHIPDGAVPFKSLIPLSEILAAVTQRPVASKAVWQEYYALVGNGRNEYNVLLDLAKEELERISGPEIAQAVILNREGKIEIDPGYDGVYGVPRIAGKRARITSSEESEKKPRQNNGRKQKSLGDYMKNSL